MFGPRRYPKVEPFGIGCVRFQWVGCPSCHTTNSVKALQVCETCTWCNEKSCSSLPYLTLPFRAGILLPSTEASSGPNATPRINHKVIETFCRSLQTGAGCSSVPVLGHPFLRNAFQRIHIVSQRWHSSCLFFSSSLFEQDQKIRRKCYKSKKDKKER